MPPHGSSGNFLAENTTVLLISSISFLAASASESASLPVISPSLRSCRLASRSPVSALALASGIDDIAVFFTSVDVEATGDAISGVGRLLKSGSSPRATAFSAIAEVPGCVEGGPKSPELLDDTKLDGEFFAKLVGVCVTSPSSAASAFVGFGSAGFVVGGTAFGVSTLATCGAGAGVCGAATGGCGAGVLAATGDLFSDARELFSL